MKNFSKFIDKKLIESVSIVGICLVLTLLVFWKVPLQQELPFPGDLLNYRFFPWNSQSEGLPESKQRVEYLSADTVRQTYPWRYLAISQLKNDSIPWWNPYAFSGTPLLANMQNATFYPLNVIYLVTDFRSGWVFQVLLQSVLSILFMYLFARSVFLSKISGLFAGFVFAFSGYMMVWFELNTVVHAGLWLPFILWTINKARENKLYYWLTIFGLCSSFFANHLQTTLYVYLVSIIFFIIFNVFKTKSKLRRKHILSFLAVFIVTGVIISVQLFPGLQLLSNSPRQGVNSEIFDKFLLPWSHLITFIAPDYYGNPATADYFGKDYGEFMAYFGLLPFILVLSRFSPSKKNKYEIFFIVLFLVGLVLALKSPIAYLPKLAKMPILESSAPSRSLFLVHASGALLAAFGYESFYNNKQRKAIYRSAFFVGTVLTIILGITLIQFTTTSDIVIKAQTFVSLKNLLIPVLIMATLLGCFFVTRIFAFSSQKKRMLLPLIFIFMPTIFTQSYFTNRYLPFSSQELIFPSNSAFEFLQKQEGHFRFFGVGSASVTSNTWLPYSLSSVEGYDSLYQSRYGQLLGSASNQGLVPTVVSRSDANLDPNKDDFYRKRLQNLLGIKYILDKNDFPQSTWEPDLDKFPADNYQLIWQENKFKIYENSQVLDRAMLIPTYEVLTDSKTMLDRIFDPVWDPTKSILLELEPYSTVVQKKPFQFDSVDLSEYPIEGKVIISDYSESEVIFSLDSSDNQLLFFSDSYYPGWKAYLDGNEVPILRANYAFRGVVVPQGKHVVTMRYEPSFLPKKVF